MILNECHTVDQEWKCVPSKIISDGTDVSLSSNFGEFRLASDTELVRSAIDQALSHPKTESLKIAKAGSWLITSATRPSCVIIEVLDECEIQCATCIANSLPGKGKKRDASVVIARMREISEQWPGMVVMLSGGEPTLHPGLVEIIRATSDLPLQVFLITNGIKLAADLGYVSALRQASEKLFVYLQYDSNSTEDIQLLRSKELSSSVREGAIENLEAFKIPYFLVSVLAKNLNSHKVGEIYSRHFQNPSLRGLVFQPIKLVGRNNYAGRANVLTRFDVDEIIYQQIGWKMRNHSANRLNWSICWETENGLSELEASRLMYQTTQADKLISVVWHSSRENYVVESCFDQPIAFAGQDGFIPIERRYGEVTNED